jgi:two-component system, cell cycle sensor histidine kinase and response regulator CckA
VMNLVINARDAMPKGGRLVIETANVEVDEDYVAAHNIDARPGTYVLLTVADSGVGMNRELQSLIFEPFFTTKDVDKGTGLGLSIVYGVVKQSGGFISVYSEPEQGATFKIYLPQVEEEQKSGPAVRSLPMTPSRAETVLLVEDETAVREAVRAFLQRRGYTVLAAKTPGIATEIVRDHDGRIDLLMTDMIMPELNGSELATRLRKARPEMKVLYMSGYMDRGMSDAAFDPGTNFLQKPFALATLESKLREILTPVLAHK